MMKRKVFAAFLAAVLTAMLLTACGGGGGMSGNGSSGGSGGTSASSPTMGEGPSADAEGGFSGGTDYGFNSSMDYDAPADLAPEAPAPGEDAASGDNDTRLQNAKMIYTANIEAETTWWIKSAATWSTRRRTATVPAIAVPATPPGSQRHSSRRF